MAKQHLILGLVLGGCAAAVACSSDDSASNSNGGAGGSAGTHSAAGTHAGGSASGGTSSGGSAGASEGGESGAPTTSEGGAGGEAGAPVAVVPPPLPLDPYTVVVTSAAPGAFTHVLVTGTDYATKGEVASIKLEPPTLEDSTVYPADAGDVVTVSSGGLAFVLQRSADKVTLVDGSKIKTVFDITDPGTNAAADIAHKAYVPMYNKNLISVLDLAAGKVARRIDLSEFNDPKDSDGSVNITVAMYDATKKLAYFVLSRIDTGSFDTNGLPCGATKALVVGIDATTDSIVDLNGTADGKAIQLYLANPAEAQLSADGKTITVLAMGCYDGAQDKQGIEQVHLDVASTTVAYAPTDGSFPNDLILLGGQQALLQPNYGDKWRKLDLSTGTIGATLDNVPLVPVFDGTDLIGVTIDSVTSAANVVRYSVATDTATTVIASPWVGKYSNAATTALVP
jgi:hypothetical protein